MYILFKAVNDRQLGIVQTVGRVLMYCIGQVPDTHVEIAEYAHLNPKVLPDNIAKAWLFFGAYREYISVKPNSLQNDQLQILNSTEPESEKVRYNLTEEDKTNTVAFMKEIMFMISSEVYDKRFIMANLPTSTLDGSTWPQQKAEALAFTADASASTPMLSALATARGITVQAMVDKVLAAVNAYNTTIATLLAKKQALEAEIKACASIADCNRLLHMKFELTMPLAQQEAEGITVGAKSDL